jgi:hypothetical protein
MQPHLAKMVAFNLTNLMLHLVMQNLSLLIVSLPWERLHLVLQFSFSSPKIIIYLYGILRSDFKWLKINISLILTVCKFNMVFHIVIPLIKLLLALIKALLPFQEKFVNVLYQATNVLLTGHLIDVYIGLTAQHIIYAKTNQIVLSVAAPASFVITSALILLRIFAKNFLFHLMCATAVLKSIFVF